MFCFLRFPSGLAAHLHLSWLDPHKERRFTVVGSKRMATFDDMAIEGKLTVYDKGFDEDIGTLRRVHRPLGRHLLPADPQPRAAAAWSASTSYAAPNRRAAALGWGKRAARGAGARGGFQSRSKIGPRCGCRWLSEIAPGHTWRLTRPSCSRTPSSGPGSTCTTEPRSARARGSGRWTVVHAGSTSPSATPGLSSMATLARSARTDRGYVTYRQSLVL